jgi:hypothetical protein
VEKQVGIEAKRSIRSVSGLLQSVRWCNFFRENSCRQGDPGPMLLFLKIFSPKKLAKILAFLTHIRAKLCKNLIITLGVFFYKNANIFCPKLLKIAVNCDHNIDPRLSEDDCLLWAVLLKLQK